jgi:dienelactone hydrolase
MKKTLVYLMLMVVVTTNAQLIPVQYSDGNQQLEGLLAKPKKQNKQKAAILILPAWMGIDANAKERAIELSKLGYTCFVADIYGVDQRPQGIPDAARLSTYFKNNIAEYHKRIQLALDQLIGAGANPNQIAAIGYCFGGTGVIEMARENFPIKGVVSFHGGLSRDENRTIVDIKPLVLALHGGDDTYVPETEAAAFREEMKSANADWQMVYYADAVHAFTHKDAGNDKTNGVAYNEKADKRSWQAMLDFFNDIFKN